MEYAFFGRTAVLRLDKGEEVIASLKKFCLGHKIRLGAISGIGAVNKAIIGTFLQDSKKYHAEELAGNMEIASLSGNITTKQGEVYIHVHVTLTGEDLRAVGGHLNAAWIGATGEFVVEIIEGNVERQFSEEIGLNLLSFK